MPSSRYIIGNLPFYSVLIVSGMVLAIFLAAREEKRRGLPKDTVLDLALGSLTPKDREVALRARNSFIFLSI